MTKRNLIVFNFFSQYVLLNETMRSEAVTIYHSCLEHIYIAASISLFNWQKR